MLMLRMLYALLGSILTISMYKGRANTPIKLQCRIPNIRIVGEDAKSVVRWSNPNPILFPLRQRDHL